MGTGADRLIYRHAGVVMVRATTFPDLVDLPDLPDISSDDPVHLEQRRSWLAQVWAHKELREAVQLASPVLAQRIQHLTDAGRTAAPREIRRLVTSLAAYLARWKGRATPFGLFAGVAVAHVGPEPTIRWCDRPRAVARADADWLATVITRLESCPGLLERLPVVANSSIFVRGDRLVLPSQPQDVRLGEFAPLEVSIRRTRPVRAAVEAAQVPVRYGDLLGKLTAEFTASPREQIAGMLTELVARHVLLSSLWPPMSAMDALGHVLAQLATAGADDVPAVVSRLAELHAIHDELSRHNAGTPYPEQARATAVERMRRVSGAVSQPLMVDARMDCELVVPETVIGEAEAATSVLLRTSPHPFGHPAWRVFHARFLERYGVGAVVPVRELVQADTGIGAPAGYLGAPGRPTPDRVTERDTTLLALVQRAVMDGRSEITLTESTVDALTIGDPADLLAPPRAELAFRIHAPSLAALKRGQFELVITGAPRTAASMAGRFASVLDAPDQARLVTAYAALPTADPDALAAQLSFPPRRRHSENVTRVPRILPYMIAFSEHHPAEGSLIPVDDLAVSGDGRHLYLVRLTTGQHVEPVVLHALEADLHTPPLARFLAELPTARSAVYGRFNWGAAAHLPYLPRLCYGRTVLSAARWLLPAHDLPRRGAPTGTWDDALQTWRQRWGAPTTLVMCEGELRLPLDLDRPPHRVLLRAALDRCGHLELREAPGDDDLGWCGRAHELLIPLRLVGHRAVPSRRRRHGASRRPVRRDEGHLPGNSRWLYAQIHGHPDRQDDIVIEHLPRLFTAWDEEPLWWFRRYRDLARPDADQHLRLYIRLATPTRYGDAAAHVADWAADMRDLGLVPDLRLGTYHPETGRYGHGTAMAAAEETFAADSAVALAQIQSATRTGTPREAICAAGSVDLVVSFAGSLDDGIRWLLDDLPHESATVNRTLHDSALLLSEPGDDHPVVRAMPGGEQIVREWARRRVALANYRSRLAEQSDPRSVLRSLVHMHHVRTIGVDPDRERLVCRLARAAALRWSARQGAS